VWRVGLDRLTLTDLALQRGVGGRTLFDIDREFYMRDYVIPVGDHKEHKDHFNLIERVVESRLNMDAVPGDKDRQMTAHVMEEMKRLCRSAHSHLHDLESMKRVVASMMNACESGNLVHFKRERALGDALLDLFEGVPASVMLRATNVSTERFDEICDMVMGLREEREADGKEGV